MHDSSAPSVKRCWDRQIPAVSSGAVTSLSSLMWQSEQDYALGFNHLLVVPLRRATPESVPCTNADPGSVTL